MTNADSAELRRLAEAFIHDPKGFEGEVSPSTILSLLDQLDRAVEVIRFYDSRAVYERVQPDGDLIQCNEIAENFLKEMEGMK